MWNRWLLLIALTYQITFAQSEIDLSYYLPNDIRYDEKVPKPKEIIGHEVGQWHVTHDKLVQYMRVLANASNRVTLEETGQTYENRPLLLLTITAPKNHENIDEIRNRHLSRTENSGLSLPVAKDPIVIYQGFSIHGNEPSGSNAALAYAYYLAAAQGEQIEQMLGNTIILLDPSFNPDGLQRFATHVNSNKSLIPNPDNNEREYHEPWPGGRTNHYWFDMNRDWLPVQLPESRARIETFHKWLPNILTDHHEMGTNATFFFQPGIPSRVHPLTPKTNQLLTAEIAQYHAKALDKIGSLYFSGEQYDDYYYGKGSTFPDINGSIGILFEQASSRGHLQNSVNGVVTFPFTIKNQMTAALSTLLAANEMREKILTYQQQFYKEVGLESVIGRSRAYIFGDEKDAYKTYHLAEILKRQHIKFHELKSDIRLNGKTYKKSYSYMVPLSQKNHRLIKTMFEKRTSFTDSVFYDISAWTFPLAFNLDYAQVRSLQNMGEEVETLNTPEGNLKGEGTYAYLFEWNEYYTPKALHKILDKGIRAKVAKKSFSVNNNSYSYGSILVPTTHQPYTEKELRSFLEKTAKESGIHIESLATGLTDGIDLGSSNFELIKKQKVALLTGEGVRSYDAGEIWHLFDTRYEIPITKIDVSQLSSADLSSYTDIIMPSLSQNALDKGQTAKLKNWVKNGGSLIGYRSTINYLKNNGFIDLDIKKDSLIAKNTKFVNKKNFHGAQQTGGAIFEAKLDLSHPINYGFKNDKLPLFRNTNIYIEPSQQSYDNPIQYTAAPLLSGYISEENLAKLKNSVPFQVRNYGKGKVLVFTDNTNFRGFWYGTNKLLMNAIFFGNFM